MITTLLCVALTSLAAGCVIGWIFCLHATSGKQTRMRRDVGDLRRDVCALKADAAKVQAWAELNSHEPRRLRAAADLTKDEALKAAKVLRTVTPSLRSMRTQMSGMPAATMRVTAPQIIELPASISAHDV